MDENIFRKKVIWHKKNHMFMLLVSYWVANEFSLESEAEYGIKSIRLPRGWVSSSGKWAASLSNKPLLIW